VHQKIRNEYLALFLMIIAVTGIGSAIALYQSYSIYTENTKDELVREAYIANSLLEGVLADASQVLDLAKPKIQEAIDRQALTKELTYKILSDAHASMHPLNTKLGNEVTIYTNAEGLIQASSLGVESKTVSLADRLYFKTLKNDPKRAYAVGNLVVGKITNELTFHIATSATDARGQLQGVIIQQVLANELANNLNKSLKTLADAQILVNVGGGKLAFTYPKISHQDDEEFRLCLYVENVIQSNGQPSGVIEISPNREISQRTFAAYASSSKYGLITTIFVPAKSVVTSFLERNLLLISFIGLAFIALAFIIYRFYKKALENQEFLIASSTDELTGLQNRHSFNNEYPRLQKDAMRSRNPLSGLFIDIDHFKIFNDDYGHDCGDEALVRIAKTIGQCASRPLDFCCRWGGEEFVVLLPNTDETGAVNLAKEILQQVRNIHLSFPCKQEPQITVSIGVAVMDLSEDSQSHDLVNMADKAMYSAKLNGRNQYSIYGQN
jgi:diguanylate cyclase (GGDEF)-like protein